MELKRLPPAERLPRSRGGSIMILVIAWIAIILLLLNAFLAIGFVFKTQMGSKDEAERIALDAATTINQGDRLGQMNNLVYAARELVFTSNKSYCDADKHAR